jgi:hypothetical protein
MDGYMKVGVRVMSESYVVEGAMLECSCGNMTTPLRVSQKRYAFIAGKKVATEIDCKPQKDIIPFGGCCSPGHPQKANIVKRKPCILKLQSKWSHPEPTVVADDLSVLLDSSLLICQCGGAIRIVDSGCEGDTKGAAGLYHVGKDFVLESSPPLTPKSPWKINAQAEMPDGTFTVKWKTKPPQNVKYRWEITVNFDISKHNAASLKKMAKDDKQKYRLKIGQLGTKDLIHSFEFTSQEISINFNELLQKNGIEYCGDDLTVRVTAMADDKWYLAKLSGRIAGVNPAQADANSYLEQACGKMFAKVRESYSNFPLNENDAKIIRTVLFGNESGAHHFSKQGIPIYGYPNGWGIMQIDPPGKEERIWSWKKNMEESAERMMGYIDNIYDNKMFEELENHPLTKWQWRILLYRRYNGGWAWKWSTKSKKWEWTGDDRYAYILKSIRTEKLKFQIEVDDAYKSTDKDVDLVSRLRTHAKNNWNTKKWYPQKDKNGNFKSTYPTYLDKF